MAFVQGFDAAYCPDPVPTGYQWCEVYIGGSSAFRAWDTGEVSRVADLAKLPVWVPTPGSDNPRQSAIGCLDALRSYGVPAFAGPKWRAVMVDLETGTEPDSPWLEAFVSVIVAHGYDTFVYGSPTWVFGYQSHSGYIVADPTGSPHLYPHPYVAGTQYAWGVQTPGGVVDLDLLDDDQMVHLGEWQ